MAGVDRLGRIHLPPAHEPLAYFISFRGYGTWLHGDERGSVDGKHCGYGTEFAPPHLGVAEAERARMKHPPVRLSDAAREIVERTLEEVCKHRAWVLHAQNARTNHVHLVVRAPGRTPERVSEDLKSWCTRRLREAGIVPRDVQPWSRGRSNPYLWKDEDVRAAVAYVMDGQ